MRSLASRLTESCRLADFRPACLTL
jgi:hypothetical protein